jgi:hypothetical protein
VALFLNLFEVTGAEDSVRAQLPSDERQAAAAGGADFHTDVERWLDRALRQAAIP